LINRSGLVFIITLVIFIIMFPLHAGAREPIRIVAGGDVMLDSWIEELVRTEGWHYPFVHLDSILSDSDLVFANLEAPFGRQDSAYPKTYTFQVSPVRYCRQER
jgi:poly-gamma-glutamate synthesis protein (capsule biosynthesis protein)